MDLASITAAYSGLKVAKDIFNGLNDLKVEAATIDKINEAVKKVADAQDTLFSMREELFRLQSENAELAKTIAESDNWDKKLSEYSLVKTPGGAVVYKFNGEPEHYICPSCASRKSIEILQDNRTYSGKYRCVHCKAEYPINPQQTPPTPRVVSRGIR